MSAIVQYITPVLFFPILCLAGIACFFAYYWRAVLPRKGALDWIAQRESRPRRVSFTATVHPMERKDALPLLLVTAVYAVTAFWHLGSTSAPQHFAQFTAQDAIYFTLTPGEAPAQVRYWPGLNTGDYTLDASQNGTDWAPCLTLNQGYGDLFQWKDASLADLPEGSTLLRLTAHPDKDWLELGELAFLDGAGNKMVLPTRDDSPREQGVYLQDEGDTVPQESNWFNSAYFDEIYHPRTAYEHIRGVYPFETTHPPLGKLIMGLGIRAFGMNPFGWRVMGTLFGVGMLPLLYLFLKNLFGKTALALCGTALFAFDFMHLTQTRLATIDTYGVFFILAMFLFLYRYLALPAGTSFGKGALPLFLSGLMFGLGAASKWTVIYGGAGLAVVYFIGLFFKWRDWPRGEGATEKFPAFLVKTLLFSVLSFVVIPGVIYTLCYIPYAAAQGEPTLQSVVTAMWNNQTHMFSYHQRTTEPHPYSSRWYQWLVDGRPILYYQSFGEGVETVFAAFQNPIVAWGGLLALITMAVQMVRQRCGKALFLLVGFFAQLLPWLAIGRTTFAYHYFPSVLFLVLALCYVMNDLMERRPKHWRLPVYAMTGSAVGLYAAFYPVLVGIPIPRWYATNFLQWLPSWPI